MSITENNFLVKMALTQHSTTIFICIHLCITFSYYDGTKWLALFLCPISCMFIYISWEEDAPCINLGKNQGDQDGGNSFLRHVYADSSKTEICPILTRLDKSLISTIIGYRNINEFIQQIFICQFDCHFFTFTLSEFVIFFRCFTNI